MGQSEPPLLAKMLENSRHFLIKMISVISVKHFAEGFQLHLSVNRFWQVYYIYFDLTAASGTINHHTLILSCGVPQGSVLAPMFFPLHVLHSGRIWVNMARRFIVTLTIPCKPNSSIALDRLLTGLDEVKA